VCLSSPLVSYIQCLIHVLTTPSLPTTSPAQLPSRSVAHDELAERGINLGKLKQTLGGRSVPVTPIGERNAADQEDLDKRFFGAVFNSIKKNGRSVDELDERDVAEEELAKRFFNTLSKSIKNGGILGRSAEVEERDVEEPELAKRFLKFNTISNSIKNLGRSVEVEERDVAEEELAKRFFKFNSLSNSIKNMGRSVEVEERDITEEELAKRFFNTLSKSIKNGGILGRRSVEVEERDIN